MEQASRLIANRIVQQAIEIKNLERAEIRRKLEEVSKKELVRRIRVWIILRKLAERSSFFNSSIYLREKVHILISFHYYGQTKEVVAHV